MPKTKNAKIIFYAKNVESFGPIFQDENLKYVKNCRKWN